jgi:glycosyltransferase involved in cell wall biosynthesis
MQLDVIIPTYNRAALLARALESLLAASVPAGLDTRITIVDNNSNDDTGELVRREAARFGGRLNYLFEPQQGRSHALNAGIRSTTGDLVGMLDDDEEVHPSWFTCVHSAFQDCTVDFVGGPYVPRWPGKVPEWLPHNYRGVIGWVDGGDTVRPFDASYPGILMGGNAVLRRSILDRVGLYATSVGRIGTRLLASEDEDFYHRLLAAGARGRYLPDLIIYHYVPPERLTKKYYRRWCFWRGVSRGMLDGTRPMPVAYFGGIPRYLYGAAARGLATILYSGLSRRRDPAARFSNELALWDLIGFFYGKHLYSPPTDGSR